MKFEAPKTMQALLLLLVLGMALSLVDTHAAESAQKSQSSELRVAD